MLKKSVKTLKGIGEKKAKAFSKIGIDSLLDLIEHYPRKYEDLSKVKKISELKDGENAVFLARVISIESSIISGGKELTKIKLNDDYGILTALYMNISYISKILKKDKLYWFYGNVTIRGNYISSFHPEFTEYTKKPEGLGIRTVYPLNDNLKQSDINNALKSVRTLFSLVPDNIPEEIVSKYDILKKETALEKIHFPKKIQDTLEARNRLAFEEIFVLQLYLLALRKKFKSLNKTRIYKNIKMENIKAFFPYTLTSSQITTIKEIIKDLSSKNYMNRLVFGDVGSGKTAVSISAAIIALNSGYQVCVMAPTEILARQHYDVFKKVIPDEYKTSLLISSISDKKNLLFDIKNGKTKLVIGTHALIQEGVEFKDLSLVITDEQHRFGVSQRKSLKNKAGNNSDVLVMSATPIPRTLTMALYGDLDISYLTEQPIGRKKIITKYVEDSEKKDLLKFISERLEKGEKVYFVAPRIEETENTSLVSINKLYKYLNKIFSRYNPQLIHGKISTEEKEKTMQDFKDGKIQILVATSVIEVGIDVPEATIIVITNVERFGLSQLHQLRGRVGRGDKQSYCFLTGSNLSEISKKRVEAMVNESSGFKIAEIDLELRGPGELLGTRQHGFKQFKIADYKRDYTLIEKAKEYAGTYLENLNDKELEKLINKITEDSIVSKN